METFDIDQFRPTAEVAAGYISQRFEEVGRLIGMTLKDLGQRCDESFEKENVDG